jgi:hypothetical protein
MLQTAKGKLLSPEIKQYSTTFTFKEILVCDKCDRPDVTEVFFLFPSQPAIGWHAIEMNSM